ncbi:hypothetical protein R3P38DRAFT_3285402 [Favolaschia claudopus]|uniref:Uncharacterized protein n=1 Tax=Favolaschia claudopus TaxID=2862362 RepID=A0AAW0A4Q2_9AGAR
MTTFPRRPQPSPSRHSLSSDDAHSIAHSVTSTAPLTAAYRPPQKDFAAAFAALQGQYGMGGDLPTPSGGTPPKKKKKERQEPPKPSSLRPSTSHTAQSPLASGSSRAERRRASLDTARALASHTAVEDGPPLPASQGAGTGAGQGGKDASSSSSGSRLKRMFGFMGKGASGIRGRCSKSERRPLTPPSLPPSQSLTSPLPGLTPALHHAPPVLAASNTAIGLTTPCAAARSLDALGAYRNPYATLNNDSHLSSDLSTHYSHNAAPSNNEGDRHKRSSRIPAYPSSASSVLLSPARTLHAPDTRPLQRTTRGSKEERRERHPGISARPAVNGERA